MNFFVKTVLLVVLSLLGPASFANFQKNTVPYSVIGGSIDGMAIIKPLPKGNSLRRAGVKPKDIVLSVDFMPIRDAQSAYKAYHQKSLSKVVVLRESKKIILEVR